MLVLLQAELLKCCLLLLGSPWQAGGATETSIFMWIVLRAARECTRNTADGFKARLDRAWGSLGPWKVFLPRAESGAGWALRSLGTQTIPGFCPWNEAITKDLFVSSSPGTL